MPAKVGGSVPATFTIYWNGGYAWQYESTLTRVSK